MNRVDRTWDEFFRRRPGFEKELAERRERYLAAVVNSVIAKALHQGPQVDDL